MQIVGVPVAAAISFSFFWLLRAVAGSVRLPKIENQILDQISVRLRHRLSVKRT